MARINKAEDTYKLIREQILSGRWKPGDRINDKELADELQVSRITVREALFKLTETKIIEKEYWKGYFIKELNDEIVSNIVELRITLESQAIRNFVDEVQEKDIAEMEKILLESQKCLDADDPLNYLTTDYQFHEYIYKHQHNIYITSIMDNYQLTIHFIRYVSMGKDEDFYETARNSIAFHTSILEAIKERNSEEAVKRLVDHLLFHKDETEKQLHKRDRNKK